VPHPYPAGEPVPDDGSLPEATVARVGEQPFGAYVHVPFCATRCGYCDFNTYTADELGGTSTDAYVTALLSEVELSARALKQPPPLMTVFFGGGTPTLLSPDQMLQILSSLRVTFGLADGCEITTEANPESVTLDSLGRLRAGGVNRISFGMQSAVPHVLQTLDRAHKPGRVQRAVSDARAVGFDNVSVDLIYGAPGESVDDWRTSVDAAVALQPNHISAYALIVEDGTRLATQVRRGELPAPDDDDQATKYELADEILSRAGYEWYEVSNWARDDAVSLHNLGYWRSDDWWGFGPGAHSHVSGVRWWNVKHPRAYAERLAQGRTPAVGRELLAAETQVVEQILLAIRLREGLDVAVIASADQATAAELVEDGLVEPRPLENGRLVLTLRGRLLADYVVGKLTDDGV
jgi:putative oxygen-independent coproporphyrinogen III oxidase